jgi:flagella basal body P-ring formation protein FlgA
MKTVDRIVTLPALAMLLALLAPLAACAWTVSLPDSLTATGEVVRLAELSTMPVPAEMANLLVAEVGQPGETALVTRQGVLRRLVTNGQASAVQFTGATRCVIRFGGGKVEADLLRAEVERVVAALLPAVPEGAPAAWCEIALPTEALTVVGAWTLSCARRESLPPGRSQLRLQLQDGWQTRELPVSVVAHTHGEVAVARLTVDRDRPLSAELFDWRWVDLAESPGGLVSNREQLLGASAFRSLSAGDRLRTTDLKPTPVIRANDLVELRVQRGCVAVSVRALARQAGSLGQTIPVRNELTGRLVNARVTGPGVVEWRR